MTNYGTPAFGGQRDPSAFTIIRRSIAKFLMQEQGSVALEYTCVLCVTSFFALICSNLYKNAQADAFEKAMRNFDAALEL